MIILLVIISLIRFLIVTGIIIPCLKTFKIFDLMPKLTIGAILYGRTDGSTQKVEKLRGVV